MSIYDQFIDMCASRGYIGARIPRFEDYRIVTGNTEYADDAPVPPGTYYVKILRSTQPHARIKRIDYSKALQLPGVKAVITGKEIKEVMDPFPLAIHVPIKYYPIAIDKVRYVGEPVAVIVAKDLRTAEDALELIDVEYEPLKPVLTIEDALKNDSIIHEEVGSNDVWSRTYRFGDPEDAFNKADVIASVTFKVPRFTVPALEPYVVVANYNKATDELTIFANEQGPFSLFYIAARALRKPLNKIRLITPRDIGGGFGVKVPLIYEAALIGAVAEIVGVPVKWVESRTENFMSSTRAASRLATFEVAVKKEGVITGLRVKLYDDYGAYPRSPEPGTFFRHYGNFVGAYRIKNVMIEAHAVVTNTVPSNPIRGFGGQHLYVPLEKVITKAAKMLNKDPLELRLINLIQPNEMPYKTPTGGVYDYGDYPAAVKRLIELSNYYALKEEVEKLRAEGKLVGLGIAIGVHPAGSSMGYLDAAYTPEYRSRREYLPKSGAFDMAVLTISPLGEIIVSIPTNPQGQGHETVIAQVVATVLGVRPEDVKVITSADTFKDPWTISTGTYSSRFPAIGINAVYNAAVKAREKLLRVASKLLNVPPEKLDLRDGKIFVKDNPDISISLRRVAGTVYWNPYILIEYGEEPGLSVVGSFQYPTLAPVTPEDEVNSSAAYAFSAHLVMVEVDPETGNVKILRFVNVDDAGTIINPGIFEQQVISQINQTYALTLYQELVYDKNGRMVTTDFDTYFVNTIMDALPSDAISWDTIQTPTKFSPVGSKGIGEAILSSAPAALLMAIEDAINAEFDELPVTPEKIWQKIRGKQG
mgnify:CR=1 FL=1